MQAALQRRENGFVEGCWEPWLKATSQAGERHETYEVFDEPNLLSCTGSRMDSGMSSGLSATWPTSHDLPCPPGSGTGRASRSKAARTVALGGAPEGTSGCFTVMTVEPGEAHRLTSQPMRPARRAGRLVQRLAAAVGRPGHACQVEPVIRLSAMDMVSERAAGAVEDVHFPQALVRTVLAEFTAPGDLILDPFAGYGTTLVVAEQMRRDAVGVELLPERAALIRRRHGLHRRRAATGRVRSRAGGPVPDVPALHERC